MNLYTEIRNKLGLSREKASELLETISPEKLERIENEKQMPKLGVIWCRLRLKLPFLSFIVTGSSLSMPVRRKSLASSTRLKLWYR